MAGTATFAAAANTAFAVPNRQLTEVQFNDRSSFKMPLHYPRYTKKDYDNMPEWKLDCLLNEYGLRVSGDADHKRKFAMGTFLWN